MSQREQESERRYTGNGWETTVRLLLYFLFEKLYSPSEPAFTCLCHMQPAAGGQFSDRCSINGRSDPLFLWSQPFYDFTGLKMYKSLISFRHGLRSSAHTSDNGGVSSTFRPPVCVLFLDEKVFGYLHISATTHSHHKHNIITLYLCLNWTYYYKSLYTSSSLWLILLVY